MAKKSDSSGPRASFTDTRRVEELIGLMTQNGLSEIELVEGQSRILLRRGVSGAAAPAPMGAPVYQAPPPAATASGPAKPATPAVEEGLVPIKSPMVGTFYSAPSPDAAPYISVGSSVDEKSVVCVIEAMKHFNEVTSEVRGTVVKVLVSNGQVVEFNQPLFMVRPE